MKDTLKTLELLEQHIDRVVENGLYEIERDLLLERLRGIYATVVATEAISEEERVFDALIGIGATAPLIVEDEPEIEIERIYAEEEEEVEEEVEEQSEEPTMEAKEAPIAEPEPEPEVVEDVAKEEEPEVTEEVVAEEEPEPAAEPQLEEEEPAAEEEKLAVVYEEEAEPTESEEIDHEAVMALYDDDDENEEQPEEPALEEEVAEIEEVAEEEEPVVEDIDEEEPTEKEPVEEVQTVVLGDILASEQTTIADNLAEQMVADVASAASANASLRSSIALNDKFILMRDLFAGNNDYYEMAIERLDSFDNLEEAMLYIHDNFHWNPNSEGARLLMELLARKLF